MDINSANQVAVTLQENNHVVIVEIEDCPGGGRRRGMAAFRTGPSGTTFLIRDGNLNDNDCVCR